MKFLDVTVEKIRNSLYHVRPQKQWFNTEANTMKNWMEKMTFLHGSIKHGCETFLKIPLLLFSGPETHHWPVWGPQRWTQPHLPAGGALWRDTGELQLSLTFRYQDICFCCNPLSCPNHSYSPCSPVLLTLFASSLLIVTWTVLND